MAAISFIHPLITTLTQNNSNQRLSTELKADSMLWGECLSGALYWNDFLRLAKSCGFNDPRLMSSSQIALGSSAIEAKVGAQVQFFSATYRLWKVKYLLFTSLCNHCLHMV
jgi:arsenite methyltransferase